MVLSETHIRIHENGAAKFFRKNRIYYVTHGAHYEDLYMFGLPILTIAAVGGTVLIVVLLLLLWGLHYRAALS